MSFSGPISRTLRRSRPSGFSLRCARARSSSRTGKKVAAFRCKNFRESKCLQCAGIKAGDTNKIIHAGFAKANTELQFDGWICFITLTLGSNGKVHRCTKFSVSDEIFGEKQAKEVPCDSCNGEIHDPKEGLHATPVHPDKYDYNKKIVEGENVGELYRTTMKSRSRT
jgi:hypothetical protein